MGAPLTRGGRAGGGDPGAVVMVLASCASLQVGAAIASRLFPSIGASGATTIRLGLAALVLLVAVRPSVRGWRRGQWRPVLAFGASLAVMNSAFYAAVARIPLGVAVTIEFLGPLVLAAALTRRVRDLTWVILALAGVALLGLGGDGTTGGLDPAGVAFALLAGACWAGYILASSRVGAAVSGQAGLAVASTIAALLVLPTGIAGAGGALLQPDVLLWGLAMGVTASVIPYSLELAALRRLPERTFGVLLSLEPAIAALAGWLLLSQGLPFTALVAMAVVVAASIGSTASAGRAAD